MASGNSEDFENWKSANMGTLDTLNYLNPLELGKVYSGDPRISAFMTEEEFNKKWNINQEQDSET